MGEIFLILSVAFQAGATTQAVRLALRQRNLAWVFLALAIALMLLRRSLTLYATYSLHRSADTLAEFLALLISLLMAIGMTLLLAWWKPAGDPDESSEAIQNAARQRLKRQAIFLALMSLLGCAGLTYFAYAASRDAVTTRLLKGSLDLANMLGAATHSAPDNSAALEELKRLWRETRSQYPDNYLCVIGADGRLKLNTRRPEKIGTFVGGTAIPADENVPRTVQELVTARRNWVGRNRSAEGESQIAAYAYSTNLNALVAVHLPALTVDTEIRAAALPWGAGIAVIFLVILPLSFGLLYYVGSASEKSAFQALRRQFESERRCALVIESVRDHAIFLLDPQGRVVTWNQGADCLRGWTEAEIKGRHFSMFYTAEDIAQKQPEHDLQLAAKSGGATTEGWRLRKDGSRFWASSTLSCGWDDAGGASGYLVVTRDITADKEAEVELQKAFSTLQLFIDTVPHFIAFVDEDERYQLVNHSYAEWFGLPRAQILGRTRRELHRPETYEVMAPHIRDVLAGHATSYENRMTGRDGKDYCFDVRFVPRRATNGRVSGYFVLALDVTERNRVESELREKEFQYRNLADSGVALIWASGTDKRCNYFNYPWLKFTGRTLEQELGNGWTDGVHPDDLSRCLEVYETAFDKRESFVVEYRLRHVSGEYRWLHDLGTPSHNRRGEFIGYLGHCFDITERRHADETLRESEARFRAIVESEPECVKIVAPDGHLIAMNPAGLAMIECPTLQEAQACRLSEWIVAEHRQGFADLHRQVIQGGRGKYEFEVIGRSGRRRRLETHAAPLLDASGQVTALLGVTHDITERKRAEKQIQHLNHVYAVLSETNQAIVREREPLKLFNEACRIAVEKGGFRLAWIGLLDDTSGRIKIAAHAGAAADTLQKIDAIINAGQSGAGCGFTERALKSGSYAVCNNIESDPQAAPWREVASRHDYRSMVMLPFKAGDKTIGTFNLYSGEAEFFDDREMKLLDELATDLGFALEVGRNEKEQRRAEAARDALLDLETKLSAARLPEEVARAIFAAADQLWKLESGSLDIYLPDREIAQAVLNFDIVDGERREVQLVELLRKPTPHFQRIMDHGAELILRQPPFGSEVDSVMFGDTTRPSASIMCVPIRWQGGAVGVLSGQSYAANAFTGEDLRMFQGLADRCGGTLERIRAEAALRTSEERFRQLAENVQEVFWVVDPTMNEVQYISPAYETIWQRTCADLYANPESWLDAIHPDDRDRVRKAVTTQQATGIFDEEYRIVRPDGSTRWIRDCGFPVRDAAGQVVRFIGVARDITERIESTAELRRREERFRSLIENVSDLITVISGKGVIGFQSPSVGRILGYRPEELTGRNVFELIHPDDVEVATAAMQRAMTNPINPFSVEFRLRHHDGTWRILQSIGRNLRGQSEDGFIVVNSRDLTESRQLEEQLRQSQKMEAIGQLAGGVAHDFNNILTVIQGYGSLLMMEEQSPEERAEAVQQIVQAAERAANLTRQLLAFSRRQVMQPRQLDLNVVVTTLTRMLERILGADVRLELKLCSRPLMTRADNGMLDQVLLNLVVNARDAMPDGGRLVIETEERMFGVEEAAAIPDAKPGPYVCLRVTDTGSGIAPEHLARIFEPFFTTKPLGKGTGLGLATVFGIVKQHGGALKFASEVGRGTTFHIYLHASHDPGKSTGETAKPQPKGGTETVLLVEDEPGVRMLTRIVLERAGYRVLESTHGLEALRIMDEHEGEVQLLLTDIVMPEGMSGRELATHIQARKPGLKVIFTSGYSADVAGRELSLLEGQNFIPKPSSPQKLLAAVRQALDS